MNGINNTVVVLPTVPIEDCDQPDQIHRLRRAFLLSLTRQGIVPNPDRSNVVELPVPLRQRVKPSSDKRR